MGRGVKILLGVVLIFFLFMVFSKNERVKKVNWSQSYLRNHKIPYGTYVVFNELPYVFPNAEIEVVKMPPYSFLKSNDRNGTYLFINKNVNIEEEEMEQMKNFVSKGNNVFISSHKINFDSLGFTTKYFTQEDFNLSINVKLSNKAFGDKKYNFDRIFPPLTFDMIDTLNTEVLGEFEYSDSLKTIRTGINFVRFRYGDGYFYFHTFPEAFTNYFVLDSINSEYTAGILSYFEDAETIFWDAYYKAGKERIGSPLHFIFNNPSLKWAYYFLIIGVIIFIIFKGRRKQKVIPIVKPEKNMSKEFSGIIANMYLATSNHKKIAEMMIKFFKENIRSNYHLDTQVIDSKFAGDLAAKINKPQKEILQTFKLFDKLLSKPEVTKEELIYLEELIESYNQTK